MDNHGNDNGGEEEVTPRQKSWYEGGPVNIRYEFDPEERRRWKEDHKRPEHWDELRRKKKEERERKEAEEKRRSEEELQGITGQGEAETGNEMEGEDAQQVEEAEKGGHNGTLTLEGKDASGNSIGDVSMETGQEVNDELVGSEDEGRDVVMQNGGSEIGELSSREESQQHTENSTENEMEIEESDPQEEAVTPPEALVKNVQNNEALATSRPQRAGPSSDHKEESLPKSRQCHPRVECPVCDRPGIVSRNLKTHLWSHLSAVEKQKALETNDSCVPSTAKKLCKCDQCEKSFNRIYRLRRHQNARHSSAETKEALKKRCCECGGTFFDLKQHYIMVHGDNLYTCMESGCGKGFKTLAKLAYHRNAVHLGIRPFQCDMCTKKFMTSGNLKLHQRRVHSKLKPFNCVKCDKVFADKTDLKRHVKRYHVEEITPNSFVQ